MLVLIFPLTVNWLCLKYLLLKLVDFSKILFFSLQENIKCMNPACFCDSVETHFLLKKLLFQKRRAERNRTPFPS
jgi:hypothetical protein